MTYHTGVGVQYMERLPGAEEDPGVVYFTYTRLPTGEYVVQANGMEGEPLTMDEGTFMALTLFADLTETEV